MSSFLTIANPAEGTYSSRNSKFIGYARPMENREQLKTVLDEIKVLHPKASHHCFAYRLYPDGAVVRVNDDGEPKGSAGKPILNAIFSNKVTNIIIIVVRYYGGKNLGIPGLIEAYKTSAQLAIEAAGIVSQKVLTQEDVTVPFAHYAQFMQFVKDNDIALLSQDTQENGVEMLLEFEPKIQEKVNSYLKKLSISL